MEEYIKELTKLVEKAGKLGEVPIGAIIVSNNKIISRAYNKKERTKNPLMHAEIIAISKACKKRKNWRLDDCDMYVTLKPCEMCSAVINETRIKNVYYILDKSKVVNIKTNYKQISTEESGFKERLSGFFESKR